MEIPSVILPTQHVGQNGLVPVDQVQMMRWTLVMTMLSGGLLQSHLYFLPPMKTEDLPLL